MASIEEKVEELLTKKIEELGYILYDVQYVKEAKDYFLRIFIQNIGKDGISLEDCEKVSNGISNILDEADYIKEQYFLEVSSTGVERVLRKDKHLEGAIGEEIEIKLYQPIKLENNKSMKELTGVLREFSKDNIVIEHIKETEQSKKTKQIGTTEIENKNYIEIPRNNIALMKVKYNWE